MSLMRVVLAASASLLAFPALSASSGGGSPPSASVPQYDPTIEYRSGMEAMKRDDFKQAEKHFSRVVSVVPRDANAHFMLGSARIGTKNDKAAAKSFEKALKLDPDMLRARGQLGAAYARLGDAAKAEAELADLKRRSEACGTCAAADDIKSAIAAVEAAVGSGPQAAREPSPSLLFASAEAGDMRYLEAVVLINERRYVEAIAEFGKAQASFGPHPDILTYIGFANRKLGRFDEAERYYKAALAAAPDHKGATEYYGELKIERGDLDGAERMLAKLDSICGFGCAEAEELRRWVDEARAARS